jgi:hypothetical protein
MVPSHRQCGEEIWRLKKFVFVSHNVLQMHLLGFISTWYDNCTVCNCRALQWVVPSAQHITGSTLPALQVVCSTQCHRKAKKIIKDLCHLSHGLFTLLPSRRQRQYRCIKA